MSLYLSKQKLLIAQISDISSDIQEIIANNLSYIPKPIIKTNFIISNNTQRYYNLFDKIKVIKKKNPPLQINNINVSGKILTFNDN